MGHSVPAPPHTDPHCQAGASKAQNPVLSAGGPGAGEGRGQSSHGLWDPGGLPHHHRETSTGSHWASPRIRPGPEAGPGRGWAGVGAPTGQQSRAHSAQRLPTAGATFCRTPCALSQTAEEIAFPCNASQSLLEIYTKPRTESTSIWLNRPSLSNSKCLPCIEAGSKETLCHYRKQMIMFA